MAASWVTRLCCKSRGGQRSSRVVVVLERLEVMGEGYWHCVLTYSKGCFPTISNGTPPSSPLWKALKLLEQKKIWDQVEIRSRLIGHEVKESRRTSSHLGELGQGPVKDGLCHSCDRRCQPPARQEELGLKPYHKHTYKQTNKHREERKATWKFSVIYFILK